MALPEAVGKILWWAAVTSDVAARPAVVLLGDSTNDRL